MLADGGWVGGSCSYSVGVRPALTLSSELLVAYDGEDDAEEDSCGDAIDLSSVSTKELVTELQRRLSGDSEEGGNARRI